MAVLEALYSVIRVLGERGNELSVARELRDKYRWDRQGHGASIWGKPDGPELVVFVLVFVLEVIFVSVLVLGVIPGVGVSIDEIEE